MLTVFSDAHWSCVLCILICISQRVLSTAFEVPASMPEVQSDERTVGTANSSGIEASRSDIQGTSAVLGLPRKVDIVRGEALEALGLGRAAMPGQGIRTRRHAHGNAQAGSVISLADYVKEPRASAKALLEAFLNGKHIDEMLLPPSEGGLIRWASLTDVEVSDATAGKDTRFESSEDGESVTLIGSDIKARVQSRYSLKLTAMHIKEKGSIRLTMNIPEVTISIPSKQSGMEFCKFSGMDFHVQDAVSENEALTPVIGPAMRQNMLWLRSEVVRAAQPALCAVLIRPSAKADVVIPPEHENEGILLLLFTIALFACFLAGIYCLGYYRGVHDQKKRGTTEEQREERCCSWLMWSHNLQVQLDARRLAAARSQMRPGFATAPGPSGVQPQCWPAFNQAQVAHQHQRQQNCVEMTGLGSARPV
eukprot:TRINITY_DN73566_c0_g1_i1.p1 TRINITY_DN73566_c0_g1~~TRINITY_DN73566_c0_g1_i1.p1  ORF type:complete len:422 (-),score=46.82 TRINITY_DN73566_c0_g1_i1:122-1387(-)